MAVLFRFIYFATLSVAANAFINITITITINILIDIIIHTAIDITIPPKEPYLTLRFALIAYNFSKQYQSSERKFSPFATGQVGL